MLNLNEQGSLVSSFQSHKPEATAGLDLSDFIKTRHNLIDLTDEGNKRGIQVLMGMGDVEQLAAGLRGPSGVAARLELQRKEEKRRKEDAKRRQLQALIDELAVLDIEIADLREQIVALNEEIEFLDDTIQGLEDGSLSVEDALNNPQIAEIIRKSGKNIDPNDPDAKDALIAILSADKEGKLDHRSDLEGQVAKKLERQDEITSKMADIEADPSLSLTEIREAASEYHETSYSDATVTREASSIEEITTDANSSMDAQSDESFDADAAKRADTADALDDLFGDDGALDFASADLGNQFASASPPQADDNTITVTNDIKLENGLG